MARLSVSLTRRSAWILRRSQRDNDISATEATRRAIALLDMAERARKKGLKVYRVERSWRTLWLPRRRLMPVS
jgi:DTW domain-containing protein YfiP